MREEAPHETGAREAGQAGAAGFLRSPFLEGLGNTLIELPERFPARSSVTPLFEYRRARAVFEAAAEVQKAGIKVRSPKS